MLKIKSLKFKFKVICDNCGADTWCEITDFDTMIFCSADKNLHEIITMEEEQAIKSLNKLTGWFIIDRKLYCPKCLKKMFDVLPDNKEAK